MHGSHPIRGHGDVDERICCRTKTGGWMGQVGCRVRLGFFVFSILFDFFSLLLLATGCQGKRKKGLRERFTRISKHVFKYFKYRILFETIYKYLK
jgi:hypothetical protein